jgi:hypothetical protein
MKPSRPRQPPAARPTLAAVMAAVVAATTGGLVAAEPVAPAAQPAAAVSPDEERFFETQVRPLLVARCQSCHGDTVAEAGLRLDSRAGALAGGDTGPVVVPGEPSGSRLLAAVRHADGLAMPPDGKLPDAEIGVLEAWVAAGLPWSGPGGDAAPPRSREEEMRVRLAESRESHWAFRPLPAMRDARSEPDGRGPPDGDAVESAWRDSAIDRLVGIRIAAAGFTPAPEAAARDLVRRLWFDLTGLPPPAAEADAFCADPSDTRYRELVERLLASPQHAEHWARRWLDLARYADTMGYAFAEQDPRYPHAWTYRDWVVAALAADMPYDRFVTLQIAADLVTPPVPPADLAALGFLTVGRTFLGNRHDIIDDQIDLVTRGLMGLTVACARCHDHKYEPVTMADYYALHGIFANSTMPEELPQIGPPPTGPEAEAFAAKLRELEADVERHVDEVHARATREAVAHAADYFLETARPAARKSDGRPPRLDDDYDLQQLMIDRMGRLLGTATDTHPVLGLWAAVREASDESIAGTVADVLASWHADEGAAAVNPLVREEMLSARPATLRDVAVAYGRLILRVAPEMAGGTAAEPDEPAALAELRGLFGAEGTPLVVPRGEALRVGGSLEHTKMRKLKQAITRHTIEAAGGPPRAMVVRDAAQPGDSRIFLRGNPGRPGDVVERRLPELLGGTPAARETSGRLDLARGIVAPDNPLTPRMLVNWVWAHHFGTGLVATADDLGLRGEPPAHPELLDDLARRFVTEGAWSLRWLHREIVTSRTWRQSAEVRPELVAADPDNRLLARAERRRLDWEAWRDSLLVAAGTLASSADTGSPRGGPGIDPLAPAHLDVRSLYTKLDRQNVPGMLRTFDIANPDTAVHVRPKTTVPQQALAALNAPLVVEAARRTAARVGTEIGATATPETFVTAVWRAALARSPHDDERAAAVAWLVHEETLDERAAAAAAAAAADPAAADEAAAHQHAADQAAAVGMPARARLAHALMATAEFQFVD